MKIRTNVLAGGLSLSNHNQTGLRVRSSIKAGGLSLSNHSQTLV